MGQMIVIQKNYNAEQRWTEVDFTRAVGFTVFPPDLTCSG